MQLIKEKLDGIIHANEDNELDLSKYKGENWKRIHFPDGKTRYVHVNRHAILRNTRDGDTFPTVIVRDGDTEYQVHRAVLFGSSEIGFEAAPEGVDANVYLETNRKIVGFVDKTKKQFLPKSPKKEATKFDPFVLAKAVLWPLKMLGLVAWNVARHTPVLSCMLED